MYLVDTNLLLRDLQHQHEQHETARSAMRSLLDDGCDLTVVPQVMAEFWNVCTRPTEYNGLGMGCDETQDTLERIEQTFTLQGDTPEIYAHWKALVCQYAVRGTKVHDARLVAAMLTHNLTHVLTFNVDDFKRYEEITAVHPNNVRR